MSSDSDLSFATPGLRARLAQLSGQDLDRLDSGVIGFDADTTVRQYKRTESEAAGLSPQRVLDLPLFTHVAPCMNNFMVAQRFEDAESDACIPDDTIDYVLTLRMRRSRSSCACWPNPAARCATCWFSAGPEVLVET